MDNELSVSYTDKISLMMFGFGDSQTPNPETVKLVESVVLKQLREILEAASRNAERRNVKAICPEDVIFLLRRDRHKMQRLVKYFRFRYIDIPKVQNDSGNNVCKKQIKNLMVFIENIDESGEMLDIQEFDSVKYDRALRAERISSALDSDTYKEYTKARQASFRNKKMSQPKKFLLWVDPENEFNVNRATVEVLEVLAYSIIAHVTDMALIIRQNNRRVSGDPLQMLTGSYYNSTMFTAPHLSYNNEGATSNSQYQAEDGSNSVPQIGQPPITVMEIREVLRRCYMPQVGYMKFNHKSILGRRKLFLC